MHKSLIVLAMASFLAGHDAVIGAAAGCVIEHHREKVQDKAARENKESQKAAPAPG
jgi:hypothetical protein